ncbi:MAG: hypothetical protein V9E81_01515 [Marmoricola sp.]
MEIGLALPQMAANYSAHTTVEWARAADEGPFSSISAGERVTFSNPEMVASLAACAAVTERVRIFANLWVLPPTPDADGGPMHRHLGPVEQWSSRCRCRGGCSRG